MEGKNFEAYLNTAQNADRTLEFLRWQNSAI